MYKLHLCIRKFIYYFVGIYLEAPMPWHMAHPAYLTVCWKTKPDSLKMCEQRVTQCVSDEAAKYTYCVPTAKAKWAQSQPKLGKLWKSCLNPPPESGWCMWGLGEGGIGNAQGCTPSHTLPAHHSNLFPDGWSVKCLNTFY